MIFDPIVGLEYNPIMKSSVESKIIVIGESPVDEIHQGIQFIKPLKGARTQEYNQEVADHIREADAVMYRVIGGPEEIVYAVVRREGYLVNTIRAGMPLGTPTTALRDLVPDIESKARRRGLIIVV